MSKVILLAPTPPPAGGIAGWTARMMDAKLKNNWKVLVVDEKSIGNREVFGVKGRKKYTVEIKRCFKIWRDLWNSLKDPEVKVVHSCIPAYTPGMLREYVCACITKIKHRKFIIHFRCTVPNTINSKLALNVLKRLCNKSDLIMVLNEQSRVYLNSVSKTQNIIIPNFISKDEVTNQHHIREEIKRIIYVGGLVEGKGIYEILAIAKQLSDIQFILIGKGNNVFEYEAKSEKLDNVIFTGEMDRPEVKQELMNADLFLFMTHFRGEGFSNALCEAMAVGLPCVVTDWAANKDMIGNQGGIVVNVGDIDGAISAIKEMRNKSIRQKMSENNIRKVNDEYTETIVVNKYVDAYEMIIK